MDAIWDQIQTFFWNIINRPTWVDYLDIGIMDTMKDLFVNFIGAVVFSVMGFFYVKTKGKGKIARLFIPNVMKEPRE